MRCMMIKDQMLFVVKTYRVNMWYVTTANMLYYTPHTMCVVDVAFSMPLHTTRVLSDLHSCMNTLGNAIGAISNICNFQNKITLM